MPARRVTQKDIATKAGVGRSTVSLALRNDPRLTEQMRKKVHKVAQQLGYSPDPLLASLANYRNRQRSENFQGVIAWVVNHADGSYNWRASTHYTQYFEGARQCALKYGYRLEEIHLQEGGMRPARTATILQARNIRGILLCPHHKTTAINAFPWQKFSAVTFGYSLLSPALQTVSASHYMNTRKVVQHLVQRGYKRIGLVVDKNLNHRCGHNIQAAYLQEQSLLAGTALLAPALLFSIAPQHFATQFPQLLKAYIAQNRLEAFLTERLDIVPVLQKLGFNVPVDIGVAAVALPDTNTTLSGVTEDCRRLGAIAIEQLVGMMQRGDCGVPANPVRLHLEGSWHEGTSLAPVERG